LFAIGHDNQNLFLKFPTLPKTPKGYKMVNVSLVAPNITNTQTSSYVEKSIQASVPDCDVKELSALPTEDKPTDVVPLGSYFRAVISGILKDTAVNTSEDHFKCVQTMLSILRLMDATSFLTYAKALMEISLYEFSHAGSLKRTLDDMHLQEITSFENPNLDALALNTFLIMSINSENKEISQQQEELRTVVLELIHSFFSNTFESTHLLYIAFALQSINFFSNKSYKLHPIFLILENFFSRMNLMIFTAADLTHMIYALRNVRIGANQSNRINFKTVTFLLGIYNKVSKQLDNLSAAHLSMLSHSSVRSHFVKLTPMLQDLKKYFEANMHKIELLTGSEAASFILSFRNKLAQKETNYIFHRSAYNEIFRKTLQLITKKIAELSPEQIVSIICSLRPLKISDKDFLEAAAKEINLIKNTLDNSLLCKALQSFCEHCPVKDELIIELLDHFEAVLSQEPLSSNLDEQINLTRSVLIRYSLSTNEYTPSYENFIYKRLSHFQSDQQLRTYEAALKLETVLYTFYKLAEKRSELPESVLDKLNLIIQTAKERLDRSLSDPQIQKFQQCVLEYLKKYFHSQGCIANIELNLDCYGLCIECSIPTHRIYIKLESPYYLDQNGKRHFIDKVEENVAEMNNTFLIRICCDEWPGHNQTGANQFDALRMEFIENKLMDSLFA
jgi:hypothetical protein